MVIYAWPQEIASKLKVDLYIGRLKEPYFPVKMFGSWFIIKETLKKPFVKKCAAELSLGDIFRLIPDVSKSSGQNPTFKKLGKDFFQKGFIPQIFLIFQISL